MNDMTHVQAGAIDETEVTKKKGRKATGEATAKVAASQRVIALIDAEGNPTGETTTFAANQKIKSSADTEAGTVSFITADGATHVLHIPFGDASKVRQLAIAGAALYISQATGASKTLEEVQAVLKDKFEEVTGDGGLKMRLFSAATEDLGGLSPYKVAYGIFKGFSKEFLKTEQGKIEIENLISETAKLNNLKIGSFVARLRFVKEVKEIFEREFGAAGGRELVL